MKLEQEIEKAWWNVKTLALTSDYCDHLSNNSQDLRDIDRIERIIKKYIEKGKRNEIQK